MNEHRTSLLGSLASWVAAGWAYFEAHSSSIAALFAVAASCFTIINVVRSWRRKN